MRSTSLWSFPALVGGLAATLLSAGTPVHAGRAETADSEEARPEPSEGSEVEVSFNPTVSVVVQPGEDIDDVLRRLAAAANIAAGGQYHVRVDPSPFVVALEFTREDGSELDQLRLWENDPGIQSVVLSLDFQGLAARIGFITEQPSQGMILVRLNERVIPVDTTLAPDAVAVNEAMAGAIRNAGFELLQAEDGLVVLWESGTGRSITRVGLRSTDPSLVTSEIALEPAPGLAPP